MGMYEIPRDTKGEGRLFYIFSTKALGYTVGGVFIGWLIRSGLLLIAKLFPKVAMLKKVMSVTGIVFMVILALLGFIIATFKVPSIEKFEITKKAAGLKIDKVLLESIKFRFKKSKVYVYDTKELVREEIIKDYNEKREQEEKDEKLRAEKLASSNISKRGYIQNGR